ncbi:hypothetical protein PHYBLDRAFT_145966 [Phycomyces blakesleeanus NRRL 1555(-)]|uniref:ATP-dependent DNA helicase n=1 Tax=Phycomyces blakesleeanus (strain ATCC 8743b / DSM 1359 / FGSC 10004 / NBRC 33097 / NRRL 1555) TaxID=763407 RepID=A0A167MEU0_PHYB8|nr:hypothetical protein PHYBLDRAFT_145966 [Phycomyces blakesleeanus NRRL 1555(-)]OAD72649.1 hypothetical protein PHYBLDRAFT_145966 [Phycomyces blakesleeanus NRRL 1555(-)]|eukprot:XP_018290689.1 hypothetical protein PHYBLDRAFT_145966 [Phycomyces blakesleeanus NRRL 1555(-)]
MIEDYLHLTRESSGTPALAPTQDMFDRCLWDIESHLSANSMSLMLFTGFVLSPMPDIQHFSLNGQDVQAIIQEQKDLCDQAQLLPDPDTLTFNNLQRRVYTTVLSAIEENVGTPRLYFANDPGGIGKTFVFNALLQKTRQQEKIALAVATSGIAALLLDCGHTAHSRFKIPVQVDLNSLCSINANSQTAQLIRRTELVI